MPTDVPAVALVVAGIVAIAAAIVWRNLARAHRLARIASDLSAADPQARIVAVHRLVSLGLERSAPILLDRVKTESDDTVLAAAAIAVLERQWEPSGSPRVQKVRWWAGTELERQGFGVVPFPAAFTRLSDMGGPRAPEGPS